MPCWILWRVKILKIFRYWKTEHQRENIEWLRNYIIVSVTILNVSFQVSCSHGRNALDFSRYADNLMDGSRMQLRIKKCISGSPIVLHRFGKYKSRSNVFPLLNTQFYNFEINTRHIDFSFYVLFKIICK